MTILHEEVEKKVVLQALTIFVRSLHTNFPALQEKLAAYLEMVTSDHLDQDLGPLREEMVVLLEGMERYDSPGDRTYSIHHNISAEKRNQLVKDLSRDIAALHLHHKKSVCIPQDRTKKERILSFHTAGTALFDQMRTDLADEVGVLEAIDFAQV